MDVRWDSQGYFKPNLDRGSDPFVISMPPPNVTGSLHMGHALFVTLEVVEMVSEHLINELMFLLYCHATASTSELLALALWLLLKCLDISLIILQCSRYFSELDQVPYF